MRRTASDVHLDVRSDPAPTRALRAALDEIGARYGLSAEELFDLKVAATEALTNALKRTEGAVEVAVEPRNDAIEVEVRNRGGFEIDEQPAPAPDAEGGRGLPLMFALVDEVEVDAAGGRTHVRMRKRKR